MKNILVTVGVILSLLLGGYAVTRPTGVVKETTQTQVGSVASPDIMSPYFSYGGVRHWAYNVQVAPTGSTTCQILSPAATTTLSFATANFTRIASTSVPIEIGYSANIMSTTTVLARLFVTGGQMVLVATSTATSITDGIVPPSTYINTKIGGGSFPGTVTPTGNCTAGFREVQ